jgi:hypothetical protein
MPQGVRGEAIFKESRPPRSFRPLQHHRTSDSREKNTPSKLVEENAAKLQDSLSNLCSILRSYEAKLFGEEPLEKNEEVTVSKIVEITNRLHRRILEKKEIIKVSEIKNTDTIHRDQCSVLERLIYLTSTRPSDGGMMGGATPEVTVSTEIRSKQPGATVGARKTINCFVLRGQVDHRHFRHGSR